MKIIITESQYRLIIEQNPSDNVYTDENEYKKALNNYNKSMKIYMFYKKSKDVRDEYDNAIRKKYPNVKLQKGKKFKTASSIRDNEWEPIISWGDVSKTPSKDSPSGFFIKYSEDLNVTQWNSKHKNDPIQPLYFEGGGGHYYPVYQKPIKPIFKKIENPVPEPIKTIKPIEEPVKQVEQPIQKVTPTQFSVTWREDLPSGKVEQNTHYFPNYEEWNKFVSSNPWHQNKTENAAKTQAEALYSGKLNISKDKTYTNK